LSSNDARALLTPSARLCYPQERGEVNAHWTLISTLTVSEYFPNSNATLI